MTDHPAGKRFAVVTASGSGPMVSYWPSAEDVVRLLALFCSNSYAIPVSVWRRRTGRSAKWEPMTI